MTAGSAFAEVPNDGQVYQKATDEGLMCVNLWAFDHKHNKAGYDEIGMGSWGDARTATLICKDAVTGVIYVSDSGANDPTVVDSEGTVMYSAKLHKFDLKTGEYLGKLDLYDETGENRLTGQLVGLTIGVDSYDHVYLLSFSASQATTVKLRMVDLETGKTTVMAELEKEADGRNDFGDVIGDITREQDRCAVVCPHSSGPGAWIWACEQGESEWLGGFEGEIGYWEFEAFSPATAGNFGISPTAKFVPGEGDDLADGRLFYIDGHGTTPALYDNSGELQEGCNFIGLDASLVPASGANGIIEFSLKGKNYIAYASTIWTSSAAYQVNIAQVADDYSFLEMKKMWSIPADGLSVSADEGGVKSGLFIEAIDRYYVEDEEGHEGVYIMIYECKTGVACYFVGDEYFNGSGVKKISADKNNANNAFASGKTIYVNAATDGKVTLSNIAGSSKQFNVKAGMNTIEVATPGVYMVGNQKVIVK